MNLETEERKFLEDLIGHAKTNSDNWRKTLGESNIPLKRSLEQKYPESFGPYQKDEEQIIQSLFDKDIVEIKIKEREIHQSLDENSKSKSKDLLKGIGIMESKINEIIKELDEKK